MVVIVLVIDLARVMTSVFASLLVVACNWRAGEMASEEVLVVFLIRAQYVCAPKRTHGQDDGFVHAPNKCVG